jgi:sugar O-acyltransferase (sialic acid O-acetyltransferase NeuD family)
MKDLIILGIGPHAREMADIVEQINQVQATWNLLGFIAATTQADLVGQYLSGLPVLGIYNDVARLSQAQPYAVAYFAPEYGSDTTGCPPQRVVSLIAPSAFVARTVQLGAGCVIYPNCFIGYNAVLGERVFMLSGSVVNHDDRLEDNVTLCTNVSLAGSVQVETGCYLGQACTVRQFVRIGRDSLIGMGSVVLEDVPANSVMVGNPARRLRDRYPAGK